MENGKEYHESLLEGDLSRKDSEYRTAPPPKPR